MVDPHPGRAGAKRLGLLVGTKEALEAPRCSDERRVPVPWRGGQHEEVGRVVLGLSRKRLILGTGLFWIYI